MNAFDTSYFNESDPFKREFIAAETALDIKIARAISDFEYESGLVDLSDDSLFIEAENAKNENAKNMKKENIFVKAIAGIFNAIRSFISGIIDTIGNIFDSRDSVTDEDFVKSNSGKKQLESDINKLNKVVDNEVSEGKNLLKKVASEAGVPDEVIDSWANSALEKVKAAAPVAIPVVSALGFNLIRNFLKNKKASVDECEKITMTNVNTPPEKQKQQIKIANTLSNIVKTCTKPFANIKRNADETFKNEKSVQKLTYEDIESKYASGSITDKEYLDQLHMLGAKDKEIIRAYGEREAMRRRQLIWDKTVKSLVGKALRKLGTDQRKGSKTKENVEAFKKYVDTVKATYFSNSSRDASDYDKAVNDLKNHILNRQ